MTKSNREIARAITEPLREARVNKIIIGMLEQNIKDALDGAEKRGRSQAKSFYNVDPRDNEMEQALEATHDKEQ